ncbi:MAG: diacylglyceryl transferase [Flavobacteriales bacterium]|nr:diacylglyceryl transferase [Flavobacteriales bacterium]|tara:strand:- start:918 stop:2057 length:1140 start_codon:yes stop_codon:yes gene_type:complete
MTYPTISHFIESITGVFIPLPIQTFGFFIVSAFFAAQYFIKKEFLRLESIGVLQSSPILNKENKFALIFDYIINGLMSFLFGYKIIHIIKNYETFAKKPQEILLSSQGSILLGLCFLMTTIFYMYYGKKKTNVVEVKNISPSQLSWNFIFIAGISGIIGAKLFSVFEDIDYLIQDPLSALFSFSGLTFYGGFIFGTLAVILYGKKYNIKIKYLADTFAPSLILAYGIGRMGCHFSGDGDWGILSNMNIKPSIIPDWMWGYNFPHNVIEVGEKIEGCVGMYCYQLPYLVYPTSLYESIFGIIAFLFLYNIKTHIKIPGVLFCIYLILNGMERFLIEIIRVTEKYNVFGFNLTQAQIIGFVIIFIGLGGLLYLNNVKHESI